MSPEYQLELGTGAVFASPDANAILAALRSLPGGSDSFAVLSSTRNRTDFVQAAGGPDEAWIVEYQEGALACHHHAVDKLRVEVVAAIFCAYADGDDVWRKMARWAPGGIGVSSDSASDEAVTGEAQRHEGSPAVPESVLLDGGPGSLMHYHGLTDWWVETFTAEERQRVAQRLMPGCNDDFEETHPLALEGALVLNETPTRFVHTILQEFPPYKRTNAWIGSVTERLLSACTRLAEQSGAPIDVLTVHGAYGNEIGFHYARRDEDPAALALAVAACERQIAYAPRAAWAFRAPRESDPFAYAYPLSDDVDIPGYVRTSLPTHDGYHRLSIIREKSGDVVEALRLAREAQAAGWRGEPDADWSRRISRLERLVARGATG